MPRSARTDSRIDLALAVACGAISLVCLVLPSPVRSNAAAALRATVMAPLAGLQERAEVSRRAFLARDEVVRIADSVTLRSLRLEGVEGENERLRKLLGLAAAVKWGFVPAEALAGRGLGDEFTITLSAGRRAGVEPLSPVVTPEGLAGMVERVDPSLSLAIIWPHPDFRVSAMAVDGSAFGIVAAHLQAVRVEQSASRYFLELRSVPLRSQLKPGTLVVSSGLGGVYPRGIPIGTVVAELTTAEGYAKSYLVRPAVMLPDIASVLIVKPERARAGLQNVWALGGGTAMDAAARRVVAAGDSIGAVRRDSAALARRDSLIVARRRADTLRVRPPPVIRPDTPRRVP